MAGASLALRVILLALLFGARRETWGHFLSNSDAGSFLKVAKVVYGLAPEGSLSLYDSRVFLGWPLAFGWALRLGLPDPAMLAISCALAALAPVLFLRLTGERNLAWYLVYLPPAWLVASVHPISEPAYLVLTLLGLIAVKRARGALAGAAGGALVLVRAFGVAWLGAFLLALFRPGWPGVRAAGRICLSAAAPVAGLLLVSWAVYGDPLRQVHVYGRPLAELNIPAGVATQLRNPSGHWGWPFENLLLTPFRTRVPLWKVAYIYAHVPVLLILAWRAAVVLRDRAAQGWQAALAAGYLGNSALIVCTGPYWGFESFDRYFVWGLPGALWLAGKWLGANARWHWLLFPLSLAAGLWSLLGHAAG
jgi:hypothetical protein